MSYPSRAGDLANFGARSGPPQYKPYAYYKDGLRYVGLRGHPDNLTRYGRHYLTGTPVQRSNRDEDGYRGRGSYYASQAAVGRGTYGSMRNRLRYNIY